MARRTDQRTEAATEDAQVQAWRGVAPESGEQVSRAQNTFLRARSRRLLGELLHPYRRIVWWLLLAVLAENAARLSMPWLVQRGIDVGIPPLTADGDGTELWSVIAVMLVALAVQAVARWWFLRQSGRIGQAILLTIRRRVFRHFQSLDVSFHDRYTSGRSISRLTSDVEAVAELVNTGIDSLVNAVLTMVGVGVLLLVLDFELGLICLLAFIPLLLVVRWFSRASARIYRRVRELSALVIVQFVESMTGIRAVQAYRRQDRNDTIFGPLSRRYAGANLEAFRLVAVFMPAIKLIGNLAICAVIVFGGTQVIDRQISIGVLAAFLLYLRMFFEPMQEISQFYNTFQSAISALEKLSGVLEEEPEVTEPRRPAALGPARGQVRFDDVEFGYVEGRPVLPGLDLTIPAGQTVALVGTTGAGKTTIAKLMARFHDPQVGAVRIDGTDLIDHADTELRDRVVLLTQENFMFEGTIGQNIAFGRLTATADEIEAAARAVGVHDFIVSLPDGYDTDIGKRGGRLSAGQRQLVAFARAFLADPAVLILDEATSSLDIPSERLVQQALQTLLADRTAVIIAHRLSTVAIADRVLVLEHGQVIEDGSPQQLMDRSDGHYARLHAAWAASLA